MQYMPYICCISAGLRPSNIQRSKPRAGLIPPADLSLPDDMTPGSEGQMKSGPLPHRESVPISYRSASVEKLPDPIRQEQERMEKLLKDEHLGTCVIVYIKTERRLP